ncbi:hypothetical protein D3C73_1411310 [compost metagenome]
MPRHRATTSSNSAASIANRKALPAISQASGMPGTPKRRTIASDAPNAAADDTPSVKGLASGLFRMVCISAPASPSAMPTSAAINADGSRMSQTITR